MKKIISIVIIVALICSSTVMFTSCGKKNNDKDDETTTSNTVITTAPVVTTDEEPSADSLTTTEPAPVSTTQAETTVPETTAPETTTRLQINLPSSYSEILAKYTEVVQYAKDYKPAYTKVEYQDVPNDSVNFQSGVFNAILSLASGFLTSEQDARSNPEKNKKGDDTYWFPVAKTEKGCLLTDVSKIEKATCTALDNGNVEIRIELVDEIDSEPAAEGATSCSSAVGSMFSPLERSGIDDTLNSSAVKIIARDVAYTLEYYDCTAVLVYNPTNNQIVTLDQFMHTLVRITSGRIIGSSAVGTVVLDNYMYAYDFSY